MGWTGEVIGVEGPDAMEVMDPGDGETVVLQRREFPAECAPEWDAAVVRFEKGEEVRVKLSCRKSRSSIVFSS